jgi:hypothetical protein
MVACQIDLVLPCKINLFQVYLALNSSKVKAGLDRKSSCKNLVDQSGVNVPDGPAMSLPGSDSLQAKAGQNYKFNGNLAD